MKFDVIIQNPPYNSDLHLKILDKALQFEPKLVVNLSPVRWLMDPAWRYKNSDRKRYENVADKISHLEILDPQTTNELFNISMSSLGIYVLKEGRHYEISMPFLEAIVDKMVSADNFSKHFDDSHDGIYVPVAHNSTISLKQRNYTYFFRENGVYAKSGWTKDIGNCYHLFHFDTQAEADNFKSYLNSNVMRNYHKICWHSQRRINYRLIPWLDFSHQWDDQQLCEHFGFSEAESDFMSSVDFSYPIIVNIKS